MSQNPNCERLFLLEVLVEHLHVLKSLIPTYEDFEDEATESPEPNFCLAVKLGILPCFELCHTAVGGEVVEEEDRELMKYVWNEGKNCLFPMTASELARIVDTTPLILVLRQNTSDDITSSITTGKTEIELGEEMVEMVREAEHWLAEEPVTEVLQDLFTLTSPDDSFIGTIQLVVRLTCLGSAVFTNFEIANRKFKFNKDDKSRIVHKCKACAPGKVVSCADAKGKVTENTELIQPGLLEYDDRATPSVQILAKPNHSQFVCSCSRENLIARRRIVKKPKTTNLAKKPVNPIQRRKKNFLAGPLCHRRNAAMRHEACKGLEPPVPARHGWAWTSSAPVGLKFSEIQGWQPGCFRKCYLRSLKNRPEVKLLRKSLVKAEKGARTRRAKIDAVPTVRLVRGNGQCHITYAPSKSKLPEHFDYSVASDDSEVELTVAMPEPLPGAPKLRHQAQQFCEEDFIPKKKLMKKKPKKSDKGKKALKLKKKKSEKDVVKPKPWDDWILKIDCHSDMKNWRPSKGHSSLPKLRRNWMPGFVPSEVRCKIDEARGRRGLPPLDYKGPLHQYRRENNIPTLHIHRKDGQYALTLRTFGPKGTQVPVTVNIARPDDFSDDSDIEFEFELPPEPTVLVAHTETQYKEKDFAPSPVPIISTEDFVQLKNAKKSKIHSSKEKSKLIAKSKRKTSKK